MSRLRSLLLPWDNQPDADFIQRPSDLYRSYKPLFLGGNLADGRGVGFSMTHNAATSPTPSDGGLARYYPSAFGQASTVSGAPTPAATGWSYFIHGRYITDPSTSRLALLGFGDDSHIVITNSGALGLYAYSGLRGVGSGTATFGQLFSGWVFGSSSTFYNFEIGGVTTVNGSGWGDPPALTHIGGGSARAGAGQELLIVAGWNTVVPASVRAEISARPWASLFEPQRIFVPRAAGGGAPAPTLLTASAIGITSTSFRPRVTFTR